MPATALQSLKQSVSRRLALRSAEPFWQARYYDFNVWSQRKRILLLQTVSPSVLAKNWKDELVATRTIGDEWLASGATALLRVPSAIIPETCNMLLNPEHPDATRIKIVWHREYPWDQRLFE